VFPRFNLAHLMWVVLLICAFSIFGSHEAEAEEALASWYGPGFHGKPTANGEPFNADGYTTAHKTLPMGTKLIVNHGGKSIPVTVNDRGPFSENRDLDLSQGAARELGLMDAGVDYVGVSCANGGSYPNCSNDHIAPHEGSPVRDDTIFQDNATVPPVQGISAAPAFSDDTAFQGDTKVQEGAGGGTHVVQPGETLSGIAAQLGTSPDYLAMHNGIANPNLIYSGQPLLY
jgi:rare lipoprotein A